MTKAFFGDDTDTSLYTDPAFYYNMFMTDFGDVQDDSGRSLPLTGTTPVVRHFGTSPRMDVTTDSADASTPSSAQAKTPMRHRHTFLGAALFIGIILSVVLLGLIAFKVQVQVR